MCGRYASSSSPQDLVEEFDVDEDRTGDRVRSILVNPQSPMAGHPDFNIAPTKAAPVVLTRAPRGADSEADAGPRRQLRLLTWGLVPSWSQDLKVGTRMTNARSETVLGKYSFVRAASRRRCLVPADGWYEWQVSPTAVGARGKPRRQPFFVHRSDGEPLAMAGLYEFWRDGSLADSDPDAWLATYTIITTRAEPGLDRIHDRQPLVLDSEDWDDWLDPKANDLTRVKEYLEFEKPGRFDAYPVSMGVNSSRTNGPQLMGVVDPTTGEIIGP
jgi:putative SOS response-associated peptidase YedK